MVLPQPKQDMTGGRQQAVMFVGVNSAHTVAMRIAREMGLRTAATDRSATAGGAGNADAFAAIDAGDVDRIVAFAQDVHRETSIIAVHGVADFAFAAVGAVHEALGLANLPPSATYGRMTDKGHSRRCWREANLPLADGMAFVPGNDGGDGLDLIVKRFGLPVVVKPCVGYGSRGVARIAEGQEAELARLLADAPATGLVIESELRGRHVNVDGIVIDGNLKPLVVTERLFDDDNRHQCRLSIHPADIDEGTRDSLFDLANEASRAIGYGTGPLTVDMVMTDDGPVLLEASPHFHDLRATVALDGGDFLRAWFSHLMGQPFDAWPSRGMRGCAGACRIFHETAGRIGRIAGLEKVGSLEGVIEVSLRKHPGDVVGTVEGRRDLCAIAWVQAPDRQSLLRRIRVVENTISFETNDIVTQEVSRP